MDTKANPCFHSYLCTPQMQILDDAGRTMQVHVYVLRANRRRCATGEPHSTLQSKAVHTRYNIIHYACPIGLVKFGGRDFGFGNLIYSYHRGGEPPFDINVLVLHHFLASSCWLLFCGQCINANSMSYELVHEIIVFSIAYLSTAYTCIQTCQHNYATCFCTLLLLLYHTPLYHGYVARR